MQAWGLRAKLLQADAYRETCTHPLYEVHPELAFCALSGAPLALSKHTAPGLELRRALLARAGIVLPAGSGRAASPERPGGGHPGRRGGGLERLAHRDWPGGRYPRHSAARPPRT